MIPQELLDAPVWCVSRDKVPLDMHVLPKGLEWGVSSKRSHSCYSDGATAMAMAAKTGYAPTAWIDASSQGVCVLDIEKECPAAIRRGLILALHDHIRRLVRGGGDGGKANAGISNDKGGGKPPRRKTKGS